MKIRFLPILIAALLLSVATSEARSRRHPRHRPEPAEVALGAADSDGGGPLARSRGLSQAESAAVGVVLAEIASSRAGAGDAAAASNTARRLSPDYYRVYSHRMPTTGVKQRVAVKPPEAKPQAVAAVPPVPAPPPVVVAQRVAVAPAAIKPPKVIPAPVVAVKAPLGTGIRMAFAPRTAVVAKAPAPAPRTTARTPVRAAFRDQEQR